MKIKALTSLRFFAALGVFMTHYSQLYLNSQNNIIKTLSPIFSEGYIWVGFFFILSGFIISYSQDKKTAADSVSVYIKKRFARIYPIHILVFIFFILYFYNSLPDMNQRSPLINIFLLQSWVPETNAFWGYNAVSWSLSVEVFFYVAFLPLAMLNDKYLIYLLTILLSILLASHLHQFDTRDKMVWFYYINPASRLVDFVTGMLLYRLYKRNEKIKKLIQKNGTAYELLSIIIMCVFLYGAIRWQFDKSWRYDVYYILPMSFIIFVFSFHSGKLSKTLSHRPLVFLGEISFCLYVTHQLTISILYSKIEPLLKITEFSKYCTLLIPFLFFSILISAILHLTYEKPIANLINRTDTTPSLINSISNAIFKFRRKEKS
ncbi:acyltransferase family protein [Serratia proteamaculans]|uniref:acyltransferase family protein n=1 Tax=Serratia proteamaculans TaxID=28151 RepID=UPI003D01926A